MIQQLAGEYDHIVAEAPAQLGDETRALMVMADVAIFPVQPTIKCPRLIQESIEVLNFAHPATGSRPSKAWLARNQVNMRAAFQKIIQRAELTPWPKLMQHLRASR